MAGERPRLLLTKRASGLKHHPGQIAFPGGKVDPEDDGPVGAALREAEEEVGLPRAAVEVLGTLPPHETVTGYVVTPVLGWIRDRFDPVAEAGEVAEVFAVPLRPCRRPGAVRRRIPHVARDAAALLCGAVGALLHLGRDGADPARAGRPDAGMTRIEGDWVGAAATQAVFDALEAGGHRAFFVGGCVRNALLGQPVVDIDISTDAVPDEVMRLVDAAGLNPVPTGIDHGTITVVSSGIGYEVTTFRRDVETDGRRAVVAFSTDVLDDARRRDFTMNALYADRTGAVMDPLGEGLADLSAGRIRFIEDAEARIREDYLRILRFFRFHAWYGHPDEGIDPEALAPVAANSAGIESLSRERLGHEMRRLLEARDPAPSLAAMAATGVLARVLPGSDPRFVAPLRPCGRRCWRSRRSPSDGWRRLAARMRPGRCSLSKADAQRLVDLHQGGGVGATVAALGYLHGADTALDVALLRAALGGAPPDAGARDEARRGGSARFPVRAADLMPRLGGPALGQALKTLEADWIASDFALTREDLLGRT